MLILSFRVDLENYEIDELVRPKGPLFHRWLPAGRSEAIVVPMEDNRDRLDLWFERKGYVDDFGGFIRYDRKRSEVDVEVMKLQAHLDGGPLCGELHYAHTTTTELEAIRQDQVGSEEYVALGKRIVDFLFVPLSEFVELLRNQYGQYWLRELRPWNAETQSLGSYCAHTLWLEWREAENQSWRKFQPTIPTGVLTEPPLPGREWAEYLTESDWRCIQENFNPWQNMPLALRLIGRAHELRDLGHLKEAFVQAVSALELSIEYFLIARANEQSKDGRSAMNRLFDLPLKTQIWILATASSLVSQATLEDALKAIDARNDIVHEGKHPTYVDLKKF